MTPTLTMRPLPGERRHTRIFYRSAQVSSPPEWAGTVGCRHRNRWGMSMTSPPVTAVVPTHDRPEMMRRAVESILDQEYDGDIEVIVVFDACEPVLPVVGLGDGRTLHGPVNEGSRGPAGARNPGILAARHALVAFLDDDDVWLPGKLRAQMEAFDGHPDALLVGTAMVVDDGEREHERLVGS